MRYNACIVKIGTRHVVSLLRQEITGHGAQGTGHRAQGQSIEKLN